MRVRAIEKIYYDRKEYMPGETFDMDERAAVDINILCVLKKIEKVDDAASVTEVPSYTTKVEEPEEEETTEETSTEDNPNGTKRRVYRRRDMRPEK